MTEVTKRKLATKQIQYNSKSVILKVFARLGIQSLRYNLAKVINNNRSKNGGGWGKLGRGMRKHGVLEVVSIMMVTGLFTYIKVHYRLQNIVHLSTSCIDTF